MAVSTARADVVVTLKLDDLANGLMVLSRENKSVLRVRAVALIAKMADVSVKATTPWSAEKSELLRRMLCVTSKCRHESNLTCLNNTQTSPSLFFSLSYSVLVSSELPSFSSEAIFNPIPTEFSARAFTIQQAFFQNR